MKQEVTPIDGFHYSTDEQFTGKYWIDGKKIYRKVIISNTSYTTSTTTNIVIGSISNCDQLVDSKILNTDMLGNQMVNWHFNIPDTPNGVSVYVTSSNEVRVVLFNTTTTGIKVILEYTKTTD